MSHSDHIRRCMEIAERGRGNVSPNPVVGCVIADEEGNIVTEGWHEKYGGPHAESIAISKLIAHSSKLTLYVSLEPCCTSGKQPPCTDAILPSGIRTVVFGAHDTGNSGGEVLRGAGIDVTGGVLESECRRQNRGFFSLLEQNRPWVTVKKAMRRDGSTDGKITSERQDAWSHARLRAMHDAILVGAGTVIADNPQLNIRLKAQSSYLIPNPRRIILDPHNEVPGDAIVLTDEDADRTLIITEKLPIAELLNRLKEKGITSVLVEGGPGVWRAFEESGLIDEVVTLVGERER